MATSDVLIANMALTGLGADRIISLTDNTETARKVNAVFATMRDEVLAAHPWNFAIERVALSLLADAPVFGYDCAFQIPTDCLRVVGSDLDENGYAWVREGDKILTDETAINIKYIKRITDATKFTPAFISAFSARLEAELAYPIANSAELAKTKYEVYALKLKAAKSLDAQEGRAMDSLAPDAWLNSRNTGQA